MKKIFSLFGFKVTVRLVLIMANMLALVIIFGDARLFFNQIILGVVLIIQVADVIRFVNHTNRELSKFLLAIKHSDFSINFNRTKISHSFTELSDAFGEIIKSYKEAKIENEAQFQYLKLVVSRMSAGIISIENDKDIVLMNKSAEDILKVNGIKNWDILAEKVPKFTTEIEVLGEEGNKLLELTLSGEERILSVDIKSMIILNKVYKLITFQDIHGAIEEKEIEAWHKLIRILTHEIMNSVTPISSLTETMQSMLEKDGARIPISALNEEIIDDLTFSLKTIQRRSDGMLEFIEDYRKLTRVAKPKLKKVVVEDLLNGIETLMHHQLRQHSIQMTTDSTPKGLEVDLDSHLVEQVLINVVTNAIHALEGVQNPIIRIDAQIENGYTTIEINDNGAGIVDKELKEIFVPFFSTKKEGSGIGLSLSKQIMHLHNGTIKVKSEVGVGTSFYLLFPTVESSKYA